MPRSARRPVVYLIGSSGTPNYGDEVITAGWLRYYAEHLPDAEVWLDTHRPGQAAVLHSGAHPHLRCVDTLYHACWNAPSDDPAEIIEFGARVVDEPGLIPREAVGLEVLARADLIHVLGGGFLNSIWPGNYALLGAAAAASRRNGTTAVLTGAGLLPAEGAADALAEVLAQFSVVDVRDEGSSVLLADRVPQLSHTGDDAFLALQTTPINRERQPATVVCLQDDLQGVEPETLADYVVRTLKHWGVDKDPVLLLECFPPGDLFLTDRLSRDLPGLVTLPFAQLWSDGFPMARGQRWLSTRFHPHLLAAAGGVLGVALPSLDYYRTKHRSLTDLGSGWTIAESFDEPVDPPATPGAPFGGNLAAIQRSKQELAESFVTEVSG